MAIDCELIRQIRTEIEALGTKHGVKLSLGSVGFDTQGFSAKLTGEAVAQVVKTATRAQNTVQVSEIEIAKARMNGFLPSVFGATFTIGRRPMIYTVTGIKESRFQIISSRGSRYVYPAEQLARSLPEHLIK